MRTDWSLESLGAPASMRRSKARGRARGAQFGGIGVASANVFGLQVLELRVHAEALLARHGAQRRVPRRPE